MTLPAPDPAFRWTAEPWGPALRCARLDPIAQHAFTSKQLKLPDAAGWSAATRSVGGSIDRLLRVKQVHGNVVRVVKTADVSDGSAGEKPDGDAIVSNAAGLVLAVVVADCVPILLADRQSGAAGVVHAGWRGTCARIALTAVAGMQREFGTDPSNLVAAIGPSIGPADYEVGETLVEAFQQAGHSAGDIARWFTRGADKLYLDLWSANRDQLIQAGLKTDRIFTCGLSTLAHRDVFASYRADGDRAGRMAALIVVPQNGS